MKIPQVLYVKTFSKSYRRLPFHIQKKVDKQIKYLLTDISYPSLRLKKMQGIDKWEARVDKSYRFTFEKRENTIILRTVGPHDEALGKK